MEPDKYATAPVTDDEIFNLLLSLKYDALRDLVKELTHEIEHRRRLHERLENSLLFEKERIAIQLNELKAYGRYANEGHKATLESLLVSIEQNSIRENLALFKDLLVLKRQLRVARAKLRREWVRRNMWKKGT